MQTLPADDPPDWNGYDVITFAVNRQGTMAAAVVDAGGEKGLLLYTAPADPVRRHPGPVLRRGDGREPAGAELVARRRALAFNDDGGVKAIGTPTGAAGDGTVKLRLGKAARNRAGRLKGANLKIALVLQAAGQAMRRTGTIALR
jgi:hypothetical protein